ncbi:trypsin-like serine peptidase [Kitasatospora misakiensis]|uniref:Trypsin-like serine peptidase n=1 Tax=Kitasatospora misakiensis TaxID=67330 RepID=A0ABW0XCD2_9ACTN
MPEFLDTLPLDFSNPAVRELRDYLSGVYVRLGPVVKLAQDAGVGLGAVFLEQPMYLVWHELMDKARSQDRLYALLDQVVSGPDTAVALRVEELMRDRPVVEAPAPPPEPGVWKHFASPDGQERQIFPGYSLLDVAFLRRGLELAPAVARLLVTVPNGDQYYGTSFRIGGDLLLTNHHVLYDHDHGDARAEKVEAWFGYEKNFAGTHLAHTVVECDVTSVVGAKGEDWAVIRVASAIPDGTPEIALGGAEPVTVGDRVYIIQHPHGGAKMVGLHHNLVRHVDDRVVQYWTDTENGSSGSPVFDERWQVVALHSRWVEDRNGDAREYRNQGVRIALVAEGLHAAGVCEA